MPRSLRFEYPGAIYHVINRGNYRSWIFEDERAKVAFEKCLFEAVERSGWVLHAYCVMSNHYHLALETPEGNLSEGMRWLQGTFAMRFNRFRKESGHLFQGRFKSILVEDADRLAWLCHYIHLNPVRAGVVSLAELGAYRFSSFHWLVAGRGGRPRGLDVSLFLEGCGGLKDGPVGRRKYCEYLALLNEDEPLKRDLLFDRMSKGWALGSKAFKAAVLEDAKQGGEDGVAEAALDREARELVWERKVARCLAELRKGESDIESCLKSADWKVAIAVYLRTGSHCPNRWLCERLRMGTESGLSRYVRQFREGERPLAQRSLRLLTKKLGTSRI